MYVLSRKRGVKDTRGRVVRLTRRGARSAAMWAAPHVNGARAWTAPRIERGGLAIKDTIAPKISEVFVVTARRVDVAPPRRRWPRVMAGTALLAAPWLSCSGAGLLTGRAERPGKRPAQAPVRRRHRTLSRVQAPAAAVRGRTPACRPRRLDERR